MDEEWPSLPNDRRPWSRDQHPHNIWEVLEWRNEDLPFIYSTGPWLLVLSLSMNWRADPPTWVFFQCGVGCRGKGILYMYMYNLIYNRSPLISYPHVKLTYISLDHFLVSISNLITYCVFKSQCIGNKRRCTMQCKVKKSKSFQFNEYRDTFRIDSTHDNFYLRHIRPLMVFSYCKIFSC